MRAAKAGKILKQVRNSYQSISDDFSNTRHYNWQEFQFLEKYLIKNAKIIDLGCGNGRLINFLDQKYKYKTYKYIGIDSSTKMLKNAKQLFPKNKFLKGDLLKIPIKDNTADIICNIAAFHHIPSKKLRLKALKEMKRILKPGGIIFMTVWNLWQKKYIYENIKAWIVFLFTFGSHAPNDLFIPWKNSSGEIISSRYYHNFLPSEITSLIQKSKLEKIEQFSVKKGEKVSFLKSFNHILIARKP